MYKFMEKILAKIDSTNNDKKVHTDICQISWYRLFLYVEETLVFVI